jgi:hypothetical protein
MIQAPQLQYMPQNSQQSAYNSVQAYQQPGVICNSAPAANNQNYSAMQTYPQGVIYNYPTTSNYAQPYSTEKSQYNGVNIQIYDPQGQGVSPNVNSYATMPAQYVPVQQAPVYFPPQMNVSPFPSSQPVEAQSVPVQEAPAAPQPQIITAEPQNVAQTPVQQETVQTQQPQAAAPVIGQPIAPDATVTPESFVGKLKTSNLDDQKAAIEEVAETVKNNETAGPILLDTQIFDALVDIIDKDTSSLEGPSPEVIALRQKPKEELTEAEKQKAETPSELEKAEINKQYALYTISYMQERLNNELEKRNGQALALKDLPCIEKVIDTAKSNPNPMLRVASIASLAHIARPDYKQDLSTIFELAKSDEDERVKDSAEKALDALK